MYIYDDEGRLTASRQEVEWDDTERAWMVSLDQYRREVLCPCGCGFPSEISQDPATEFAVTVPPPTRCHIRTAMVQEQKAPRDDPEGLLWGVELGAAELSGSGTASSGLSA